MVVVSRNAQVHVGVGALDVPGGLDASTEMHRRIHHEGVADTHRMIRIENSHRL